MSTSWHVSPGISLHTKLPGSSTHSPLPSTLVQVLLLSLEGNNPSSQTYLTSEPSEKGSDCPLTSTLPLYGAAGEPQVRAVRSGLITMLTVHDYTLRGRHYFTLDSELIVGLLLRPGAGVCWNSCWTVNIKHTQKINLKYQWVQRYWWGLLHLS